MNEARLFALQRLTAMILAPLIIVHVAVILYAVGHGLSAQAILARTTSTAVWPLFYLVFVVAVSIHAPIGLRNVLREWTWLESSVINWISVLFGVLLAGLGVRAVLAISGWLA